jgi:hypothetical protein
MVDFYTWYADRERLPSDPPLTPEQETEWIRNFSGNVAWHSYRQGKAEHDGDCTNMPYTCNLCALEDLLSEYRKEAFSTVDA